MFTESRTCRVASIWGRSAWARHRHRGSRKRLVSVHECMHVCMFVKCECVGVCVEYDRVCLRRDCLSASPSPYGRSWERWSACMCGMCACRYRHCEKTQCLCAVGVRMCAHTCAQPQQSLSDTELTSAALSAVCTPPLLSFLVLCSCIRFHASAMHLSFIGG